MSDPRRAIAAALALAGTLLSTSSALANPLGLDGYTGKGGANVTCNTCHNGGTAPTVMLTGPTGLTAGQSGEFKLRVQTGAAIVGMGAAASDGATVKPGTNTKQKFAEVAHASLVQPNGGVAEFTFSVTASAYNGPMTVWAVANACNNDDNDSGDRAAATMITIPVTGGLDGPPPPPPPPAPTNPPPGTPTTPNPDGGAPIPSKTGDGGAAAPGGNNAPGTSGSSNSGAGFVGPEDSSGDGGLACATKGAPMGRGSVPLAALIVLALGLWRRARKTR